MEIKSWIFYTIAAIAILGFIMSFSAESLDDDVYVLKHDPIVVANMNFTNHNLTGVYCVNFEYGGVICANYTTA
jgi:predicted Co/Zn/Cd cation transporter (cation efflux family)